MIDLNKVRNWLRVLNDTSFSPRIWQIIALVIGLLFAVAILGLSPDPISTYLHLAAGAAVLSVLYGIYLLIGQWRFRRYEKGQKRKPQND